jgi:predicted GNAT family acetyltransferase
MTDRFEVRRNPDLDRYELLEGDDILGIADYRVEGDTVVFPHTVVDPRWRGQGLGAVLVEGALRDVRTTGRAVVPRCWYVKEFIDKHPQYKELLAA